jgi:hypothetical protein
MQQEKIRLQQEMESLEQDKAHLLHQVHHLSGVNTDIKASLEEAERVKEMVTVSLEAAEQENASISASLEVAERKNAEIYGGEKLTDKQSRINAIGLVIVSALTVIMKHTQPITRLRTVCDCIFGAALFGVEATKVVLSELYKKHFFDYVCPLTCLKGNRSLSSRWAKLYQN